MTTTAEFIKNAWKGETLEAMKNFIRIPSKSSAFEADWEVRGELLRAVRQAESWGHQRFPEGMYSRNPVFPPHSILIFQLSEVTLVVPSFSTVISTNNQKLKDGVKDSAPGHLL